MFWLVTVYSFILHILISIITCKHVLQIIFIFILCAWMNIDKWPMWVFISQTFCELKQKMNLSNVKAGLSPLYLCYFMGGLWSLTIDGITRISARLLYLYLIMQKKLTRFEKLVVEVFIQQHALFYIIKIYALWKYTYLNIWVTLINLHT